MKKNKNGFTLIEAIGVIIVIALVSIVTVPIIIQSTDKIVKMKSFVMMLFLQVKLT